MRRSMFGDFIVESAEDSLYDAFMDFDEDAEFFAMIEQDPDENNLWFFTIQEVEMSEQVATSEAIFTSEDTIRDYLRGQGIKDIQTYD